MKTVVVLSGGLDSSTVLAMCAARGDECFPLVADYKQRHAREISSAFLVAEILQKKYANIHMPKLVHLGLDFGGSALTDLAVAVPSGGVQPDTIPVTYVPARNSILLAVATSFAESIGAENVAVGFNAVDYSGYPDCREAYVHAMEAALALGTKRGVEGSPVRILAPIISLDKLSIVREAFRLGVPVDATWSCYAGQEVPCGVCDSCRIRNSAIEAYLAE